LFEPECRTPRQMQLANALCGYLEKAKVVKAEAIWIAAVGGTFESRPSRGWREVVSHLKRLACGALRAQGLRAGLTSDSLRRFGKLRAALKDGPNSSILCWLRSGWWLVRQGRRDAQYFFCAVEHVCRI